MENPQGEGRGFRLKLGVSQVWKSIPAEDYDLKHSKALKFNIQAEIVGQTNDFGQTHKSMYIYI